MITQERHNGLGVILSTEDGQVLEANQAAQEMLGYELDELRAMPAIDLSGAFAVGTEYLGNGQHRAVLSWLQPIQK